MKKQSNDFFTLYDLRIEVCGALQSMVCSHQPADYFLVQGENLIFPKNSKISLYAMAALLPLLPAKQRVLAPNDWMNTDNEVACPDPYCGARFKITRLKKRSFRHSETSNQSKIS